MDLDQLLKDAAPRIAERTPDLERNLRALIADTERAATPPRRRYRAGLIGAVVVGVIGAGSAGAIATGLVPAPTWVPWSTSSGSTCTMNFWASAPGPDGLPRDRTYTAAEKQRALVEADHFLKALDYDSIDVPAAIREFQRGEDAAIAGQPDPDERQPRIRGDELEITAVGVQVWRQLSAHLEADGIPSALVAFSQGWRCS